MPHNEQPIDPITAHRERMASQRRRMTQLGLRETVEIADLLDKVAELEASVEDAGTGTGRGTAPTLRLANLRRALQVVLSLDLGNGSLKVIAVDAEREKLLELAERN